MTPSTSEEDIGTTIPESVRKWLHRAPIPGEPWDDAAILFEAAENWAAACFPDSAQDMVDAFDYEAGSGMEWSIFDEPIVILADDQAITNLLQEQHSGLADEGGSCDG